MTVQSAASAERLRKPFNTLPAFVIFVGTVLLMTGLPFVFFYTTALSAWAISYGGFFLLLAVDYCILPAFEDTLRRMERYKVSRTATILGFMTGVWTIYVGGNHLMFYILQDVIDPWRDLTDVTFARTVKIIATLAIMDVYFTYVHREFLHRLDVAHHWVHHAARMASFHAAALFHPSDYFAEFGGPVVIMCVSAYLTNDVPAFCQIYLILSLWYTLDHDPFLRLPHWTHHRTTNSHYSVYNFIPALDAKSLGRKDQTLKTLKMEVEKEG